MKRFMEMFEQSMVAIAFAEEGVPLAFLSQEINFHEESEEQAWELR